MYMMRREEKHDYLGFRVHWMAPSGETCNVYYAIGPNDDVLGARTIEELRAKIWRYWYAVELEVTR